VAVKNERKRNFNKFDGLIHEKNGVLRDPIDNGEVD